MLNRKNSGSVLQNLYEDIRGARVNNIQNNVQVSESNNKLHKLTKRKLKEN